MIRRSWKEFDYLGSILIIAAAVLVVFAFQNAGESPRAGWDTAVFIAPLTIGLILWLCLFAWGYFASRNFKDRLALVFPIDLFSNRAYAAAAISTLFIGYPYLMICYAFPLRAQITGDKSPLSAGLMLLPMLGSAAVGSILSGAISKKKNYLFETMLAGACMMTLGTGLLTTVHDTQDDAKALGFIVFAGLGFGLNTAAATMLTSFEVPIVDYGMPCTCSASSHDFRLIQCSAGPRNYSPAENPWGKPGYLHVNRLHEHKVQRARFLDAAAAGHAGSR